MQLKCANYSLSAILRMLNSLDKNLGEDIGYVLNKPEKDEDIVSVYDKLITLLNEAKENAVLMKNILIEIKNNFSN